MSDQIRELVVEKMQLVEKGDYYALLGVTRGVDVSALREAHAAASRRLQGIKEPDLAVTSARVLRAMNEAFTTLSDPKLRLAYDQGRFGKPAAGRYEVDPKQDFELHRLLLTPTAQLGGRKPEVARMLHHKGAQLFNRRDFAGAERYLRRALELDASVPDHHLRLGWTLFSNADLPAERRVNESRELIERAINMAPGHSEAHYSLACYWREMGEPNQHRTELEAAANGKPKHARAIAELKELHDRENRASDAERKFAESKAAEKKRFGLGRLFGFGDD